MGFSLPRPPKPFGNIPPPHYHGHLTPARRMFKAVAYLHEIHNDCLTNVTHFEINTYDKPASPKGLCDLWTKPTQSRACVPHSFSAPRHKDQCAVCAVQYACAATVFVVACALGAQLHAHKPVGNMYPVGTAVDTCGRQLVCVTLCLALCCLSTLSSTTR